MSEAFVCGGPELGEAGAAPFETKPSSLPGWRLFYCPHHGVIDSEGGPGVGSRVKADARGQRQPAECDFCGRWAGESHLGTCPRSLMRGGPGI